MERKNPQILKFMQPKRNPKSKNNPESKERQWGLQASWIQNRQECHSSQNCVLPAAKQAERPRNHKEGILNKFTHVRPNDLRQGSKMTKSRKDGLFNNQQKGYWWNERKYLQTLHLNKGPISRIYSNYYNSASKQQKANNWLLKMCKGFNRHVFIEDREVINIHRNSPQHYEVSVKWKPSQKETSPFRLCILKRKEKILAIK